MRDQMTLEGAWLEAIALFQQLRAGDQHGAAGLLASSSDQALVTSNLLRLFGVFLRSEDETKLDHFTQTSLQMGPPPARNPLGNPLLDAEDAVLPAARGGKKLNDALQRDLESGGPVVIALAASHAPVLVEQAELLVKDRATLVLLGEHTGITHGAFVEVIAQGGLSKSGRRITGRAERGVASGAGPAPLEIHIDSIDDLPEKQQNKGA